MLPYHSLRVFMLHHRSVTSTCLHCCWITGQTPLLSMLINPIKSCVCIHVITGMVVVEHLMKLQWTGRLEMLSDVLWTNGLLLMITQWHRLVGGRGGRQEEGRELYLFWRFRVHWLVRWRLLGRRRKLKRDANKRKPKRKRRKWELRCLAHEIINTRLQCRLRHLVKR